ncbi:hypothetical protein TNCV_732801 [Trichonephila clavipes]|nr:hypothetical protein TNCV_732801 [Trichonephila clavipes]
MVDLVIESISILERELATVFSEPCTCRMSVEYWEIKSKWRNCRGSDDENEMNKAAPVPTSTEMRNIMKSMRNYLDAYSNGEKNKKLDSIEQLIGNLMLKNAKKLSDSFPKTQ